MMLHICNSYAHLRKIRYLPDALIRCTYYKTFISKTARTPISLSIEWTLPWLVRCWRVPVRCWNCSQSKDLCSVPQDRSALGLMVLGGSTSAERLCAHLLCLIWCSDSVDLILDMSRQKFTHSLQSSGSDCWLLREMLQFFIVCDLFSLFIMLWWLWPQRYHY